MQKIILWKEIDLLVCRKDVGIFFKSTFYEQALYLLSKICLKAYRHYFNLYSETSDLRTEVRGDFNIHGTKFFYNDTLPQK